MKRIELKSKNSHIFVNFNFLEGNILYIEYPEKVVKIRIYGRINRDFEIITNTNINLLDGDIKVLFYIDEEWSEFLLPLDLKEKKDLVFRYTREGLKYKIILPNNFYDYIGLNYQLNNFDIGIHYYVLDGDDLLDAVIENNLEFEVSDIYLNKQIKIFLDVNKDDLKYSFFILEEKFLYKIDPQFTQPTFKPNLKYIYQNNTSTISLNNNKSTIIQPIFIRTQPLGLIKIYKNIKQTIALNLDIYKAYTELFKLKIGDYVFVNKGYTIDGAIFEVLVGDVENEGSYFILDDNYNLITTGNYNLV